MSAGRLRRFQRLARLTLSLVILATLLAPVAATAQAPYDEGPSWSASLRLTGPFYQACVFAGSLTQVSETPDGLNPTLVCGRGTVIVLQGGEDYFGCLYAGSLSRVGTSEPNCSRGTAIGLAAGSDYHACLFAGSLSQFSTSPALTCGRGVAIGLLGVFNRPPETVTDTYETNEDTLLSVAAPGVLDNDSDPEGDGMTAVLDTAPQHGYLTLNLDGSFTYLPDADYFGLDSFTYRAVDDYGAGSGPETVSITVHPVNDVPSFVKGPDVTVLEDSGAYAQNWASAISSGPANEGGQQVSFEITANDNEDLFSTQPAVNASGVLTFTPAQDEHGSALVTLRIRDDGGTDDGGVDTSATQTFTITVTSVNDAPSFTSGGNVAVLEDSGTYSEPWATNISAGPANESGQALMFVVTGNDNEDLFAAGPAIATDGTLSFTPADGAFGSAEITVELRDDGGTADGGVDASEPVTFTITVDAVNNAPSFTKGADQTVNEDAGPQTVEPWATGISAGPPNESDQELTFVVTDNTNPGLFSDGPEISEDGVLTYTPADDANGEATITIVLQDDGGTDNGGVDTSASQTFDIAVNAVNDAPVFTAGADVTVLEDSGAYSAGWATGISAGPADESGQALEFDVDVTSGTALFSTAPAISDDGTLTFTPADNAFGVATIEVTLEDDGGTANGGEDTSATHTLTITITAVNDAPVLDLDDTTDGVQTSDTVAYSGTQVALAPDALVTDIDSANFDGGSLTVSIEVATSEDQLILLSGFTVAPNREVTHTGSGLVIGTVDASDNGEDGASLTIALNANATPGRVSDLVGAIAYLTSANPPADASSRVVTIVVVDGDGDANGGADSASATVTVVHNQPPTAGAQSVTTDEDVALLITLTGADADNDPLEFRILTLPDDGTLFVGNGTTTPITTVPFLLPSSGTQVTYLGDLDFNGSDSFTFAAFDGANDSDPATISISITSINDAPSFLQGGDQGVDPLVLEDAGAQTVPGWATDIVAGPDDEVGQELIFLVSNDNNALFSAQPAIQLNGTLTYTPAPDAYGSALVSVRLQDDGPQGGLHEHQSAEQTFTITITPVNDAPSFTPGADVTVDEDSGAYSATWATGISAGPNESLQVLTFAIDSNSNPDLFSSGPAIAANGTLTFTPAADAYGAATLSVRLTDDGGTANGGVDTTTAVTLVITVNAVNDPPALPGGTTKSYDATAHLELTVTQDLLFDAVDLANEVSEGSVLTARVANDPTSTVLAAGAELPTSRGGTVIITADGFRYQPPVGVTGAPVDTASYYICDSGYPAPGLCVHLTLSFAIGGELVWFINGTEATDGDGTMFSPFNNIGSFNTYNAANSTVTAGDVVFLYSGTYTTGITLVAGQRLFGQGAPGGTIFHTATGLAAPVSGSAYPSIIGTAPNLDSASGYAVTLNSTGGNNTLRYLTLGTAAGRAAAGVTGTGFGTLTVGDVSIDTDGQAVSLTTGSLTPTGASVGFGTVNSLGGVNNVLLSGIAASATFAFGTGTLSGATSHAVTINGQSGGFTFGQTVQNAAASQRAISIVNRSGGSIIFSGSINPTGGVGDAPVANSNGISIENSPGTYTFTGEQIKINSGAVTGVNITSGTGTVAFTGGRLVIVTATGAGLSATGGTLRVTGANNSITSNSIALNVNGGSIGTDGLTFMSISSSGSVNGIVLNNTGATAGLTVTGNGGVCTNATPTCTGGTINGSAGSDGGVAGSGIYIANAINVSLSLMRINGAHSNYGIRGSNVTNVTLSSVVLDGSYGDQASLPHAEGAVVFNNLLGTSSISSSYIRGGLTDNMRVVNDTGTMTLSVSNTTIRENNAINCGGTGCGNDGINFEALSAANMTLNVTGGTFTAHKGDHVNVLPQGSGTVNVSLTGGIVFSGGHANQLGGGITMLSGGSFSGQLNYTVSGNTITGTYSGGALHFNKGVSGGGTFRGTVSGNTIGQAGVANSGCADACSGVRIEVHGGGSHIVHILNNGIYGYNQTGIDVVAGEGTGTATGDVTIRGNTIGTPGANTYAGILFNIGTTSGNSHVVCADIGGVGVQENSLVGSRGTLGVADVLLDQRFATTIRLPGYTGTNTDTGAVETYIQGRNSGTPSVVASHNSPTGGGFVNTPGGVACASP